jgi:hypothetical protein
VKDELGHKFSGICCIPSECDKVCVGLTGHAIETRCKEHARYFIEEVHCINFKDTRVLARTTGYMDQIVKEPIEIQLHPRKFKRDMRFNLS